MLTYKDCVSLTGLEAEEISAIAQHEHLPEIVAAELGCCLAHQPGGEMIIDRFIRDDIALAIRRNKPEAAMHWQEILGRFEATHEISPQTAC
jgi:hypothetical protein